MMDVKMGHTVLCVLRVLLLNTLLHWGHAEAVSRPEISSFLLSLFIGLVCGILPIILLLLLCCYKGSKDPYIGRTTESHRTDQGSALDQMVTQHETQVHSPHLHGL